MKFQVAKCDLMTAIDTVAAGMSGSGDDLSTHYLFRLPPGGDGTRVEVLTYTGNSRVFAGCSFVAAVIPDGKDAFTVSGWRLRKWMPSIPDGTVFMFDFDGHETTISCSDASILDANEDQVKFASLDPNGFPFWDQVLKVAKPTMKISADRIRSALDCAKRFASDEENSKPHMCVCEVRNGMMMATDGIAAVAITMPGVDQAALRIHVKDAQHIGTFLSSIEGEVEVLEHDRCIIFRRSDGSYYGETRIQANFPGFRPPTGDDQHWWVIPVDGLKMAMSGLQALASRDDNRIRLDRPDPTGPIKLSMMLPSGKETFRRVPCSSSGSTQGAPNLPANGFTLPHAQLMKALDVAGGTDIRIGINVHMKNGYIKIVSRRFDDTQGNGGDEYLVMMAWLR